MFEIKNPGVVETHLKDQATELLGGIKVILETKIEGKTLGEILAFNTGGRDVTRSQIATCQRDAVNKILAVLIYFIDNPNSCGSGEELVQKLPLFSPTYSRQYTAVSQTFKNNLKEKVINLFKVRKGIA